MEPLSEAVVPTEVPAENEKIESDDTEPATVIITATVPQMEITTTLLGEVRQENRSSFDMNEVRRRRLFYLVSSMHF